MKIVVDKKIKKIDGDVEDILSTSQIVEETEDIRITETQLDTRATFTFSANTLKELHIESDNPVTIELEEQGSPSVSLYQTKCFSFIGVTNYIDGVITNNSDTNKAKIKVVVVE